MTGQRVIEGSISGRLAARAISPGDPLLPILNQDERHPRAPANVRKRTAAVERHDQRGAFSGLIQALQAAEVRETWR